MTFTNTLAAGQSRPPVHPRRNVEDFPATPAKMVRFHVFNTNVREPCLDELEIYAEGDTTHNLALAVNGAHATASGVLAGYEIHQVRWVNDGVYGNMHSWIADTVSNAWVQVELPEIVNINRVVWSRDREGYLIDRLATDYRVEVSTNGADWTAVASSADRRTLPAGGNFSGYGPGFRQALLRFAPISTTLPQAGREPWLEYRVDHWQTEDGLPGNEVTALLQARDGYLWVGTSAGLARFDGTRFLQFGEREGLMNGSVLCLFEDRAGTLWVGTDGGGLLRFANGRFEALTQREGLCNNVVRALAQDVDGRLWIGTDAGLDCWRDGFFLRDTNLPPREAKPFSRVLCDRDCLWVVINGFLHQVKQGQYVRKNPEGEPGSDIAVAALRSGPAGRLWFGGLSGHLNTVSNGLLTQAVLPGKLSSDTILDVCETRNGSVWIGMSSTGLRRWRGGEMLSLTTAEGLADNSVRCLLEDHEGNLWVGTSAGGLQRIKPKKIRLVTTEDGLTHNSIMSLAEDNEGIVWIGSNGGGLSFGRRQAAPAGMATGNWDMEFAPAEISYLLENECLSSVLAARDGSLWLGTWNSGLFRKTGAKLEQFHLARPENDEPILALCEDRDGGIWVGTHEAGLSKFKDGAFVSYHGTNALAASFITSLAEDATGRLWIGTGGEGLSCYEGGGFSRFTSRDGLAGNFVRTIYPDREGRLWVGMNSGLSLVKDGRIYSFTTAQGLWDDTISQILEDDRGELWFGSNRGIFHLAKSELENVAKGKSVKLNPVAYGKAEGVENLECTGGFCPAGLKTRDGRLWFGTVKGIAVVDPKNIPANTSPPTVKVDGLRVNGVSVADTEVKGAAENFLASGRNFVIGPGARRVEFRFAALSLTSPEKVRFRYLLEGLDADWVDAGLHRVAEYSYLPPGEYRFCVMACNEDLVWSTSPAVLSLKCLPAFWQTGWFRLLALAAALGGTGWVVKVFATRRLKRRLEIVRQQHALEQERIRIARDIHDELGTLLTGISLLSDRAQAHRDRPEQVGEQLQKISQNARSAVQSVDGIVWAINPQNDTFDNLANYLVQFAEDFFRLTAIRCRLDVPADVPAIPLGTQQRHHILLAVKEACNNVVRHSGAGEVWVRLKMDDAKFSIAIEDNGRGFTPGEAREGSDGLRNLQERMAQIGGGCEVRSEPGRGTSVRLFASLGQNRPTS